MPSTNTESVTELLLRWRAGDRGGLDRLMPLVESELRRIAHHYLRQERAGHTLQTTALVNEAYLRLVDQTQVGSQNRVQFLGLAANLIRQILVDYARRSHRQKRGGGEPMLPLDGVLVLSDAKSAALVALDDALTALARFDPRRAKTVELRYFGGMSVEETAEALGVHPNTVIRDWGLARVWLKREVGPKEKHAG